MKMEKEIEILSKAFELLNILRTSLKDLDFSDLNENGSEFASKYVFIDENTYLRICRDKLGTTFRLYQCLKGQVYELFADFKYRYLRFSATIKEDGNYVFFTAKIPYELDEMEV